MKFSFSVEVQTEQFTCLSSCQYDCHLSVCYCPEFHIGHDCTLSNRDFKLIELKVLKDLKDYESTLENRGTEYFALKNAKELFDEGYCFEIDVDNSIQGVDNLLVFMKVDNGGFETLNYNDNQFSSYVGDFKNPLKICRESLDYSMFDEFSTGVIEIGKQQDSIIQLSFLQS